MRLETLELENWCTHGNLTVDLSASLQIEGRNGTGKSSILEALRFIFKETARGYAKRIRNGERVAAVRLRFEADGVAYAVEKKIYLDKASTALMTADGTLVADNPSTVHRRLQAIIPEEIYEKLLYIPQGGLTEVLVRLSGKDGKLEMDRLFGLDRLETVWEKAGVEIQRGEAGLNVLGGEFLRYPPDAEKSYRTRAAELSAKESALEDKLSEDSKSLGEAASRLTSAESRLKSVQEARRALEAANRESAEISALEAGMAKELESVKARLEEMREKKRELEPLNGELMGLQRYGRIRPALNALTALTESKAQLDDVEAMREKQRSLLSDAQCRPALEVEYSMLREALRKAEAEHAAFNSQINEAKRHLADLNCLGGQAKCPRCGQRLNAFHLGKESTEANGRITELTRGRDEMEALMVGLKVKAGGLERRLDEAKSKEARVRQLEEDLKVKTARLTSLKMRLEEAVAELSSFGYAGETPEVVDSKCETFNRLTERARMLAASAAEIPALSTKETLLSGKLASLKERKTVLAARSSELRYDEAAERSLSLERDKASEDRHRLEYSAKAIGAEIILARTEIKAADESLTAYLNLATRHAAAKKRLEQLKAAREFFHRDKGIAKYLRESFVQRLNSMLSLNFKRFNQNPKYVDVAFDKEYCIVIRTQSGDLEAAQLSGGELAQLALALRVSLIDLMSPIRLLILDEPFGSLDELHREILGEALNRIAGTGQLILVTHIHTESLQLNNRIDLGGY